MSVYIIAEAGVNHNGDITLAKQLIDMAVDCKADAIKFQTFTAEECCTATAKKVDYQKSNDSIEENQYEMIKKLELTEKEFKELKQYCEYKKIEFLSTPDGIDSLNILIALQVNKIKIGSTEVTNHRFLREIAKTHKPIILSTGMSTLKEVEEAVNCIKQEGNNDITVLHCTTQYPTLLEDVNLRAMTTLEKELNMPVGLSDHTTGCEAAIAAVALGAKVIEKHITLNKDMEGPDHKASMEKEDFRDYVESIRNTEKLLGNGIKEPTKSEKKIINDVRRSIIADKDILEGSIITCDMLSCKRPGTGIPPVEIDKVVGCKVKKDIKRDELIRWEDLINQ